MNHSRPNKVYSCLLRAFITLGLCCFLNACATVPLTERKSLHLVSDAELLALSIQQRQHPSLDPEAMRYYQNK